jgi:hypothetical protein
VPWTFICLRAHNNSQHFHRDTFSLHSPFCRSMLPLEPPALGSLSSAISTATDCAGSLPPLHILYTDKSVQPRVLASVLSERARALEGMTLKVLTLHQLLSCNMQLCKLSHPSIIYLHVQKPVYCVIQITGNKINYALTPCRYKCQKGDTTLKITWCNWWLSRLWKINTVVFR